MRRKATNIYNEANGEPSKISRLRRVCRRDTVVEDSWTILEPKPLPRAVPVGMRMLGQLKVNGVLVLVLGLAE